MTNEKSKHVGTFGVCAALEKEYCGEFCRDAGPDRHHSVNLHGGK